MAEHARLIEEKDAPGADLECKQPTIVSIMKDHEGKAIGIVSITLFLVIWEYVGTSGLINPMFTSAPSSIWKAGLKMFSDGEIWNHLSVSATEFALGYAISVVVAIPMGILLGWYRRLNYAIDPFVSALYATPRIAFLPLLIIWFGIGMNSKIAVIFLGAVFPILISTFAGVRNLDESLLKAARSFGANDRQVFLTIALPGSVPFIITGLRLGIGRALIGVVVGEMYAATAGLGYLMSIFGNAFQTDRVFVLTLIIAAWGLILMRLLQALEDRFEAWRPIRV